jgi:uncharacterized membrane protein YccC
MNFIIRLIVALLIGLIVAWLCGLIIPQTIAVLLGVVSGLAYLVNHRSMDI